MFNYEKCNLFFRMYENVPRKFMPVFYFSQRVELRDYIADNLRLIQNLPEYSNYAVIILISLGIGSILWSLCSYFCCSRTKDVYQFTNKKKINGTITSHEEVPLNDKR